MTGSSQISNFDNNKALIDEMILQKNLLLDHFVDSFANTSNLQLKFGFECEFYLKSDQVEHSVAVANQVANSCVEYVALFNEITAERGYSQYEFTTKPSGNIADQIQACNEIKKYIASSLNDLVIVDFSAKPYPDDCANALQLNFSIFNDDKNLIFTDKDLAQNLASFLVSKIDDLMIFANAVDDDFLRYDIDYNRQIHQSGKFVAPTVKCWGFDNRSCAIRIVRADKDSARIEIRLPSNNCQLELFSCVLLFTLSQFFKSDIDSNDLIEPIYGNAFDEKYNLPTIFSSQNLAIARLFKSRDLLQAFIKAI